MTFDDSQSGFPPPSTSGFPRMLAKLTASVAIAARGIGCQREAFILESTTDMATIQELAQSLNRAADVVHIACADAQLKDEEGVLPLKYRAEKLLIESSALVNACSLELTEPL